MFNVQLGKITDYLFLLHVEISDFVFRKGVFLIVDFVFMKWVFLIYAFKVRRGVFLIFDFLFRKGVLRIKEITTQESGVYTCKGRFGVEKEGMGENK